MGDGGMFPAGRHPAQDDLDATLGNEAWMHNNASRFSRGFGRGTKLTAISRRLKICDKDPEEKKHWEDFLSSLSEPIQRALRHAVSEALIQRATSDDTLLLCNWVPRSPQKLQMDIRKNLKGRWVYEVTLQAPRIPLRTTRSPKKSKGK